MSPGDGFPITAAIGFITDLTAAGAGSREDSAVGMLDRLIFTLVMVMLVGALVLIMDTAGITITARLSSTTTLRLLTITGEFLPTEG
jgi:hypothetical protein